MSQAVRRGWVVVYQGPPHAPRPDQISSFSVPRGEFKLSRDWHPPTHTHLPVLQLLLEEAVSLFRGASCSILPQRKHRARPTCSSPGCPLEEVRIPPTNTGEESALSSRGPRWPQAPAQLSASSRQQQAWSSRCDLTRPHALSSPLSLESPPFYTKRSQLITLHKKQP